MKVVYSLSEDGYVTDPARMLEYLVSYYILSEASQSVSFQGSIINLPETYYLYLHDPDSMANAVRSDLERLLSKYYTIVDVSAYARKISEDSTYAIVIGVSVVTDEGKKVELSRVAELSTAGLRNIINVNNYGDGVIYVNSI